MHRERLYCRTIVLAGIVDFIKSLGGDANSLLAKAKLPSSLLVDKESFVSWSNVCYLLELCASDLNEPHFGIKWAMYSPDNFRNTGPSLLIMRLVPDIRSYLDASITYQKIHTNGMTYNYKEDSETKITNIGFDFHTATAPHKQYAEYMIMTMVKMARLNPKGIKFDHVHFQHSAPEDIAWYEATFGCSVCFNMPRSEIHILPPFLDLKFDLELKVLKPLLRSYLNEWADHNATPDAPMSALVQGIVSAALGVNKTDIITIAHLLDISSKKLQRLLKEEGTTYTDLRDNLRNLIAVQLLKNSDISIAHLARFLDYTMPESFNAACKRWTGLPPQAYRKSQNP